MDVVSKGFNHRRTCLDTTIACSEHAEMYCLRKVRKLGLTKFLDGAIMVVVRRRRGDNSIGCAKPCEQCTPVLYKLPIKVYYTK
uniref:CMP/dCMP-type deaminase domain-containing protein n=1 Tax=viral metagenome TaxID=1070528 RepID=A0A6C0J7Z8_9ZZZZ